MSATQLTRAQKRGLRRLVRRIEIYEASQGFCALCDKSMTLKEMTIDHIRPRGKGGTNAPENLQGAHRRCNAAKGSRFEGEIARRRRALQVHVERAEPTKKEAGE